jgi:hypothetical protein
MQSERRSAAALGLRLTNPFALALQHHLAFEASYRVDDREKSTAPSPCACRCRDHGFEEVVVGDDCDTAQAEA